MPNRTRTPVFGPGSSLTPKKFFCPRCQKECSNKAGLTIHTKKCSFLPSTLAAPNHSNYDHCADTQDDPIMDCDDDESSSKQVDPDTQLIPTIVNCPKCNLAIRSGNAFHQHAIECHPEVSLLIKKSRLSLTEDTEGILSLKRRWPLTNPNLEDSNLLHSPRSDDDSQDPDDDSSVDPLDTNNDLEQEPDVPLRSYTTRRSARISAINQERQPQAIIQVDVITTDQQDTSEQTTTNHTTTQPVLPANQSISSQSLLIMHGDAPDLSAEGNNLTHSEIASIELLSILQQSNAPIGLYNKILNWAKRGTPESLSSMKGRESLLLIVQN